jgi:Carboxypeptidase regulatory-like domain
MLASLACAWAPGALAAEQKDSQLRTLTGRVFTGENQPVAKAVVYLKNTKTLAVKTYISDTDGTYRFPALSPNVDYEVYAEYNGAHSDTKTLSAFDSRKQANITLKIHAGK